MKPQCIEPLDGQELCTVCGDIANGLHFGVMTCEGCKVGTVTGYIRHQFSRVSLYMA